MTFLNLLIFGLFAPSLLAGVSATKKSADSSSSTSSSDDLSTTGQYLGYGYNAFKGSVYQTSDVFRFNSPILKRDLLKDKFVTVNTAKTIYSNNTSTSKTEISKELGQENSGGASTTAQAQIGVASINASLNATFNMTGTESWNSVQNESFSYYNIYAQKDTVALQIDFNESSSASYFTDEFLKAARNIVTEEQAESFFNTYGTHLVTGYNLGGLFQMTNYYATKSSSYVKESTTSFATQVETGVSVMNKAGGSVGAEYSFTERYGTKDNNSNAVNQYKLLTYGGKAFSGLTIDQAFTFSATLTEQGDYLYGAWVKSINEGTNNVIISIPDGSPMIPLYKALPNDGNYKTAKSLLLNKYLELTQEAIAKYRKNNKDAIYTDMKGASYDGPSVKLSGYDRYSLSDETGCCYYSTTPLSSDDDVKITVRAGDRISLNFTAYNTEGTTCAWYLKDESVQNKYIEPLGEGASNENKTYDSFQIKKGEDVSSEPTLTLVYASGAEATKLKQISVKIVTNDFIGGTGTEDDPYLIANKEDFGKINDHLETDDGKASCFKLACDITLDSTKDHTPIGTYENPFKGTFDGDGHAIKGLKLADGSLQKADIKFDCKSEEEHANWYAGLFGVLDGGATVKNLIVEGAACSFSADNFVWNAGIICARNGGTISNCYVKNSTIKVTEASDANKIICKQWGASLGGICGALVDSGVVKGCGINDSTVSATSHGFGWSFVGGLIGAITAKTTVSSCYVTDCTISNVVKFDWSDSYVYVGGLVGYTSVNVWFSDCLGRNNSLTASTGKACDFIALGGFIGRADIPSDAPTDSSNKYILLKDSIIDQSTSEKITFTRPESQTNNPKLGSLIGDLSYSGSNNINSFFDNAYCKSADVKNALGGERSATTATNIKDGSSVTGLSTSIWAGTSFEKKTIKTHTVKDVAFTFTDAKRDFVKGEPFFAGGIYGTKEYADGTDAEKFENFFIDDSKFDSKTAGTYEITVKAYGVSGSYSVTVHEAKATRLDVALNSSASYYAGDALDENDISITAYYEDGTTSAISGSADGVEITKNSKTLAEGQNKIEVTYQNVSSYFIVKTEKKEIESIAVLAQPTKTSYSTKDKTVDLSGLALDVAYSNEGLADETVLYSMDTKEDFMAYYGDFNDGSNKIDIVYKEFQAPSIYVEAVSPALDAELLTPFIEAVAALDNVTSLETYRTALIEAMNCRAALQNKYAAYELAKNDDYVAANTKLESCISEYKQAVGEINSDYETAIAPAAEISMGFVGGFETLLAVLECVFSFIFGI